MLGSHPSAVAVSVYLVGSIQVLGIQTHDCKRKHDLQKSHDNVDNILHAEARVATVSQTHDESMEVYRWDCQLFCCGKSSGTEECCSWPGNSDYQFYRSPLSSVLKRE